MSNLFHKYGLYLKSRTLWVNAIALALLVAQYVLGEDIVPATSEQTAAMLTIINLVLRLRTTSPLFPRS